MISLDNTEIAFKGKSDKDLKRGRFLFNFIGNPIFQKIGKFFTLLALKLYLPVKGIIKRTIFKQFCGGENIEECNSRIEELSKYKIGTILDYSVEGKSEEENFEATCREILLTIDKASKNKSIPFAVFKITGVADASVLERASNPNADLSESDRKSMAAILKRVDTICKKAYDFNTRLFIDAEDSWCQDTLDRIIESMMVKYNKEKAIVFNTIQLYRVDRLDFFKDSLEKAKKNGYKIGMKLVRGAYMEKERERALKMGYKSPIYPTKEATDNAFNAAIKFCIDNLETISFCNGTHNEKSVAFLLQLLDEHGISHNDPRVFTAQLLGMSDNISYNLAEEGYNVAKYVPYGPIKEVMPYLIRRAEENSSVAGQTSRELILLKQELKRRKNIKK